MKKIALLLLGVLFVLPLVAQQSPAAGNQTAPTVDETTLKFSDTPAAPGGTAGQANQPGPVDLSVWDFVRMFLILGIVIGMIYGFILFLRKISGQQGPTVTPIKILTTQILSGNRALYIVEVGNEVLLVGAGDGSVNLVKTLTDQETIDNLRLAASQAPVGKKKQFTALLSKFIGKPEPKDQKGPDPVDQSADFLKKQRDRLKNL